MNKKLKIAVIGLGWVTLNRHIPSMEENPKFEIIGVIDRHEGRAEEVAKARKYKHFSQSSNLENIEWLNKVDAITIGTNPHAHYELIKSAFKLGKHVLTEKPFVMKVEEGEEIAKLSREKNLVLGIVHNFQFSTSGQKLIRDIESGKFGKIKSIVAQQLSNPRRRLPKWYEQLPLGLFYDESPHFFYLISRLSPPTLKFIKSEVFPSTCGLVTPAIIDIKYVSESKEHGKIPVNITMNFEAPLSEWHIMVHGENYVGDIDIFRDIYICLPNDGLHVTSTVFRTSLLATVQHWSQHFTSGVMHILGKLRYGNNLVFDKFADAVLFNKPLTDIGIENALRVLKMQHEVIKNHSLLLNSKEHITV